MGENELRDLVPPKGTGEVLEGVMSVAVKTEKGFTLTQDYGFTVQEEDGKVVAFDLLNHPELGIMVLFGQQVFALSFWKDEDLDRGLKIIQDAVAKEKERRKNAEQKD